MQRVGGAPKSSGDFSSPGSIETNTGTSPEHMIQYATANQSNRAVRKDGLLNDDGERFV